MTNVKPPRVSVIIPSYNTGKTIGRAIDSAVKTNYGNLEIVVVDDGSSDNSLTVLRDIQRSNPEIDIKLLTHPGHRNKGIGLTRNLGIVRASGEYITFLDADDVYLPNRFESCIPLLESNRSLDAVWEPFEFVLLSGKRAELMGDAAQDANHLTERTVVPDMIETTGDRLLDSLTGKRPVHTTAITIRKSTFDATGYFPALKYCLELALWYKIFARKRVMQAGDQVVSRYYVHAESHISRHEESADFAFDTIRALLHGYCWMKKHHADPIYIKAFRDRIIGKWLHYCTCVLDKQHSFAKDVLLNLVTVGLAVPELLVRPVFWKAGFKLVGAKAGLVSRW